MNRFLQFATEYQPGDKGEDHHRRRRRTGVELSAELYNAGGVALRLRLQNLTTDSLEGDPGGSGPRIRPAPERISGSAHLELVKLGVDVRTATMITEATAEGLQHLGWGAD